MFYYNRYNDLTKFITNENELKITNEVEIYISDYYDISIDLSYLNSINELDKEFICTISKNVCDIDNTVQKYCQYILKEPDFDFDLAIISIKNNNSIIVDYWGNVVDLESTSYLSAKTRLGEPTVRIALLPPERFEYFCKKGEKHGGRTVLSVVSKEEAREILKSSVSVRAKLLHSGNPDVLFGRRLLEGVQIYPAVIDKDGNMQYTQINGTEIIVNKELGVTFKDGDVSESIV